MFRAASLAFTAMAFLPACGGHLPDSNGGRRAHSSVVRGTTPGASPRPREGDVPLQLVISTYDERPEELRFRLVGEREIWSCEELRGQAHPNGDVRCGEFIDVVPGREYVLSVEYKPSVHTNELREVEVPFTVPEDVLAREGRERDAVRVHLDFRELTNWEHYIWLSEINVRFHRSPTTSEPSGTGEDLVAVSLEDWSIENRTPYLMTPTSRGQFASRQQIWSEERGRWLLLFSYGCAMQFLMPQLFPSQVGDLSPMPRLPNGGGRVRVTVSASGLMLAGRTILRADAKTMDPMPHHWSDYNVFAEGWIGDR